MGILDAPALTPTAAAKLYSRRSQVTLAALGDSITACDNGTNYEWSTAIYDTNCSWLEVAVIKSNSSIEYGGNFGVPGETSTQILARVSTVIAAAPTHCTILAGANDSSAATVKTNIQAIASALRAAGITPILCTLPPNRTLSDSAVQTKIRQVNAWLRAYSLSTGVPLLDFYSVLANPADGDYLSGYYADTVHPNRAAYALMANEVIRVLAPQGTTAYRRVDNSLLGSEVVTNGLFLNFTGADANNFTTVLSDANITTSQSTDTSFAGGKALQLANVGTASKNYLLQQSCAVPASAVVELGVRVKLAGIAASEGGHPHIEIAKGDNTVLRRIRFRLDCDGTIRHRFVNPAGNTTIKLGIRWQNANANTSCTFKLGELTMRDLTALGAA